MSRYRLFASSGNKKLGELIKTYASRDTCNKGCPFINDNGCFGENYHQKRWWDVVDNSGSENFDEVVSGLAAQPLETKVRVNVVGDHNADEAGNILPENIQKLSRVVKRRKLGVVNYTHHPLTPANVELAKSAGFIMNFSTETVTDAKKALDSGVNAVISLHSNYKGRKFLKLPESDLNVVICPEQVATKKKVTCSTCMLCSQDRVERRIVVGFIAHGTKIKKADKAIGAKNEC
jgi:hypothetical protein